MTSRNMDKWMILMSRSKGTLVSSVVAQFVRPLVPVCRRQ